MSEGPTKVHSGRRRRARGDGRAFLRAVEGPGRGRTFEMKRTEFVIGRGDAADASIEDEGMSRAHAKVVRSTDGIVNIVDLESTNGTFVNGTRIDFAVLREGDRIELGPETVLVFSYSETERLGPAPVSLELSKREREVAQLVAQGLTNAAIAKQLHISPRTVTTHLERIYARLEIGSRAELVRLMAEAGLLAPSSSD